MFRQLEDQIPYSLINFAILKKIKDIQLILLYLIFESNNLNFETFSSQYKISYDSYKTNSKALQKQQIIKAVNKSDSRFKTYKLIKPNIQIFPHASKAEEELIFKHLHSLSTDPYIQIILNPHALQLLKQIKKKI